MRESSLPAARGAGVRLAGALVRQYLVAAGPAPRLCAACEPLGAKTSYRALSRINHAAATLSRKRSTRGLSTPRRTGGTCWTNRQHSRTGPLHRRTARAARSHDGQLRPAVGVESFQVLRHNRSHPELADHFGWTYNHAPMIVYWNDRFYLEYLSNPVGEHIAPGQTLLSTSPDGREWSTPQVIFPIYNLRPPDAPGKAMMHQRMGFFIAPDGRLLVLPFTATLQSPLAAGESAGLSAISTATARSARSISSATTRLRAGDRANTGLSLLPELNRQRFRRGLRRSARQPPDARAVVGRRTPGGRFLFRSCPRQREPT